MNGELIPQLCPLAEHLSGWRGSLVEVVERITRSPGTLDRHCTTRSSFVMRLEFVGLTFSGASLTLLGTAGEREASYQATCDCLESLSIDEDEVVLVERLGKAVERHSTCRLVDEEV